MSTTRRVRRIRGKQIRFMWRTKIKEILRTMQEQLVYTRDESPSTRLMMR